MWSTLKLIVEFIVGLTIVISLHELGHLFNARKFGVEAEEIGLGLPPRMFFLGKVFKIPFSINWLPLGAFVKIKDESGFKNEPGGLFSVSPIKRIMIFAAGPITNLLIALVIFTTVNLGLGTPDNTKFVIESVTKDSPAEVGGLLVKDIIIGIDNKGFNSYDEFFKEVENNAGGKITLDINRNGKNINIELSPRKISPPNEGPLGISLLAPMKRASFFEALLGGVDSFTTNITLFVSMFSGLLTGKVNPGTQLVGFKGMFDLYSYIQGDAIAAITPPWISAFNFFGLISMSLGLINLLPIPALDGGRIFLTLPELFFKVKISRKVENILQGISFALLIALMIYVNFKDFISPLHLPGS